VKLQSQYEERLQIMGASSNTSFNGALRPQDHPSRVPDASGQAAANVSHTETAQGAGSSSGSSSSESSKSSESSDSSSSTSSSDDELNPSNDEHNILDDDQPLVPPSRAKVARFD
jgi:hypothetical protein